VCQCKYGRKIWDGVLGAACDAAIKNLAARRAVCYVVLCQPERLLLCATRPFRKGLKILSPYEQSNIGFKGVIGINVVI